MAAAVSTPSGAPPVPMTACTPVPDHGRGDAGGEVAVADQPDARARLADLGDQALVARPVEHDDHEVVDLAVERLGDGLQVLLHGGVDVDLAPWRTGPPRACPCRCRGRSGGRPSPTRPARRWRWGRRWRRGSCPRGGRRRCPPRSPPLPTFSPMNSIGASSRSPSPMTMVPSMSTVSMSLRMASTATWSEYFRSPWPMVRAAGDGGVLHHPHELEKEVLAVHFAPWTR